MPVKLAAFLKTSAGASLATRFQLRVLARKLSPSYTPSKSSPVITAVDTPVTPTAPAKKSGSSSSSGAKTTPSTSTGTAVAASDCDADGVADADELDDDNDLLPDFARAHHRHEHLPRGQRRRRDGRRLGVPVGAST